MANKSKGKPSAEETIRTIRRATRKNYTADDKIRIVLEGLRGESGIRELCRREGIATSIRAPINALGAHKLGLSPAHGGAPKGCSQ
jgi:transposase-like protein